MNDKDKTREQLTIELQELQQKYDSLKEISDKVITKHKQAEKFLLESNENLSITLHSIGDGVISTDKNGLIVQMNPIAEKLCGWKLADAAGKPLTEVFKIINAETRESVADPVRKVLENGEIVGLANHTVLISKNGNEYQISDSAAPIKTKEGEITGVVLVFSDVTESYAAQKQMNISEERYRSLSNNLEAGIVVHAPDTSIVMNNPRASELLGLTNDQMRGKAAIDPVWKFVNEDNIALALEDYPVNRIVSTKQAIKNQILGIHQPGKNNIVWVTVNGFPALNKTGEITEIVISFIDITEHKQAEEELRESEEKLRSYIDFAPHGVFVADRNGNYLDANSAASKISGYNKEELLSMNLIDLIAPESLEGTGNHFNRVVNEGFASGEATFIRKDGSKGYWTIDAVKLSDDRFLGFVVDITERKKTEKALQESEERFKRIFENKGTATGIFGEESIIKDCNAFFTEISGYSKSEIIDKMKWSDFVLKEDLERLQKYHSQRTENDNPPPSQYECSIINKSGEPVNVIVNIALIGEDRIVTLTDITERKQAEQELNESEVRFRELVNTINSGVAIYKVINDGKTGSDYIIQEFNEFALKHEQLEKKDVIGKSLKDIRPNIDEYGLIDTFQKVWKNGEPTFFPAKVYVDEKYSNYYENKVFRLPSGEIVAIYDDVSDRENAIAQIKESQERFDLAMKASNDGIFDWNLATNEIYYSPRWKSMLGYEDEELANEFSIWEKLTDPKDAEQSWEMQQKVISKQLDRFEMEFKMKHKDGHWVDILSRAEAIFDDEGKAIRMIGTHVDISERKQAEEDLKESEASLQDAQRIANIGNWSLDIITGKVHMSDEMFKLIGIQKSEAPDVSQHEKYYTPESWLRFQDAIKEALEMGKSYEIEMEFANKNSEFQHAIARGEPVYDKNNMLIALKGTLQDITQQNQYEAKLIEAKEKAEESDRLKSAFLANMSHEIRTPMNGILGFSGLLKQPKLSGEQQQKYIGIIEKSGARMLNIINDIVDISKIEAGLMTLDITESDINDQIEYIYTFFKPEVEAKGMKLTFKNTLTAKGAIINTDREKLFAILTNLIKNAIKYSEEGSIEFGYDKKGKYIEFYVKDSGIGIKSNRQEAIFERFIQADIADKNAYQGAGLGLSISKAYVEMLGGKLWVESETGIGSTFYFTIPYTTELQETDGITNSTAGDVLEVQAEKLKIIIVEDDETSDLLINIMLTEIGKEILHAKNGLEAIELCRNNPDTDLLLMDIKMPVMGGHEATRQIRQFNKDVIIIAQTAHGLSGDKEKAIVAGCNGYISKPIIKVELMSLIQQFCIK